MDVAEDFEREHARGDRSPIDAGGFGDLACGEARAGVLAGDAIGERFAHRDVQRLGAGFRALRGLARDAGRYADRLEGVKS